MSYSKTSYDVLLNFKLTCKKEIKDGTYTCSVRCNILLISLIDEIYLLFSHHHIPDVTII